MGKKGPRRKVSDQQISRALARHEGRIGAVAEELEVTSATIKRRMKDNPRIQAKVDDALEKMLDKAVGVIADKLDDGNLKAAQYVLDNTGKDRGFGAKQKEVVADTTNNTTINILDTDGMDLATKKLLAESLKKQQQKLLEEGEK